jgi:hypothetical protein
MKIRLGARSFFVSLAALGAMLSRLCACSTTDEIVVVGEIPFDGGFLGPCSGDASVVISALDCPTVCPGSQAQALCVGNTYSECACLSVTPPCDSGCCFPNPVSCKDAGKVAMTDPAEGQCDAELGYLVCNGTCYASFSCDLPDGYEVFAPDGGPDAHVDGAPSEGGPSDTGADSSSDSAPIDASVDVAPDAGGEDATPDSATDGGSPDATDAESDASSEAGGDG